MQRRRILTHPGDILREELKFRKLSANKFALYLGVPSGRIVEILNRQRGVSADTALRIARYFGTGPEVWMNLQSRYDLEVAQEEAGDEILLRVRPVDTDDTAATVPRQRETRQRSRSTTAVGARRRASA
jgi:addiction module HigA family antidote